MGNKTLICKCNNNKNDDCFGSIERQCMILSSTTFSGGICPFKKTKEQYEKDDKLAGWYTEKGVFVNYNPYGGVENY